MLFEPSGTVGPKFAEGRRARPRQIVISAYSEFGPVAVLVANFGQRFTHALGGNDFEFAGSLIQPRRYQCPPVQKKAALVEQHRPIS